MKVAVEGCAHGELEIIYDTLEHIQKKERIVIDLLICCGDFQATRNADDMKCMAVPAKFLDMCSFYKYYSGEKRAPVLTLFIGGNHEASNHLQELPYGGWVAPNIFYLGYAGVVNFKGLRIGGISGIYKGHDYLKGHHEKVPYDEQTKRSVYHVRNLEVFRLKQLTDVLDIFISHDWPRGIYNYGDAQQLLTKKPFFKDEIENNTLGSRCTEELLHHMRPRYWFAAHLHVQFVAIVKHGDDDPKRSNKCTHFLALDKCLPKRRFLQVLDITSKEGSQSEGVLEYDLEWLTVLRNTNHLLNVTERPGYMPGPGYSGRWNFTPTKEELTEVSELFGSDLRIPDNFKKVVEPYDGKPINLRTSTSLKIQNPVVNEQTVSFCSKLGVTDPIALLHQKFGCDVPGNGLDSSYVNPSEADVTVTSGLASATMVSFNAEEIQLDSDAEEGDASGDETPQDSGGVSNLFFLDKRGETTDSVSSRRTSLKLPKPVCDSSAAGSPSFIPFSTPPPSNHRNVSEESPSAYKSPLLLPRPLLSSSPLVRIPASVKAANDPEGSKQNDLGDLFFLDTSGNSEKDSAVSDDRKVDEPDPTNSSSPPELKLSDETSPSGPKKFKRRNLSLYASAIDEEQ